MNVFFEIYAAVKRFISIDFWAEGGESSIAKRIFARFLKIWFLAIREFMEGQCLLKASALTFVSLISLVPLLAFVLSVSKGLGAEKALDQRIDAYIFSLPGGEVVSSFVSFKRELLEQIENLELPNRIAQRQLIDSVEKLDAIIPSMEKTETMEPSARLQKPAGIPIQKGEELLVDRNADGKEIRRAVETLKMELYKIIKAVNFNSVNAKNELREQIKDVFLSIPSNISLNAYQYKHQIMQFVGRTSFGYVGAIGLIFLLIIVIKTLGTVEKSFNDIWKIKKSRSIFRKFTDYTSMLIIIPILLLTSTTITAILTNEKLVALLNKIWIGKIYLTTLGWFLPLAALWVAYVAVYMFIPNTRVKLIPGIIGGLIGGTLFYLLQILYFRSQIGLSRYNVIYGAFAAVPFFLFWLQMSWTVVLFGAELSYVIQNITAIKMKYRSGRMSYASRELIGLIIMERISSQFLDGKGERWSDEKLSETLNVPIGTIRDILSEFTDESLLVQIANEKNTYFIPGRDLESIFLSEVVNVMRNYGERFTPVGMTPRDQKIAELIGRTQNMMQNNLQITMKEILENPDIGRRGGMVVPELSAHNY